MKKSEAGHQKESFEPVILCGETAALWLSERGLFSPESQSPPTKIFTVRITGEMIDTINSLGNFISLDELRSRNILGDQTLQELSRDESDPIGVKLSGQNESGENFIEIVWALEY